MKLIGYSYSHSETGRIIALLKSKGIPTHVTYAYYLLMTYKAAIFACIDHQLHDAKSVLLNQDHAVSNPVDIEDFENILQTSGTAQF